jgi:hypothetical protein
MCNAIRLPCGLEQCMRRGTFHPHEQLRGAVSKGD